MKIKQAIFDIGYILINVLALILALSWPLMFMAL